MDKKKNALKNLLPTRRRLVQLYTALLYNAHLKGFINGSIYTGNVKALCLPGLNCYSCPGAVGSCPLGAMQNAVSSANVRTPYYVVGIVMLMGIIFGRTICGWLCPMGMLQDLLYKIPTPKVKKGPVTRALSWLKYVILIVFVLVIPFWYALMSFPLPAFCKYICPAGTFEGAVGLLSNPANANMMGMLGILFTRKMVILGLLAGACVFVFRAFCRFLCPLGAIYGLFSRFAFIGVKVDVPKCVDCGKCVEKCKLDVRHVGDHACIHCGECISDCPTGAISFRAGKITLMGNEGFVPEKEKVKQRRRGRILWGAAAAVLVFALWYFNR